MIEEQEIINDAVLNLKRLTGLEEVEIHHGKDGFDYDVIINGKTFACEVKGQVNKANYNVLVQKIRKMKTEVGKPIMVVASHIVPEVYDRFIHDNISVIESNGNCRITSHPLYIHVSGQKAVISKKASGKAFNEAGLKVIFHFLVNEANINKPYRSISDETGISLGTIKNVMDELKKNRFVAITNTGRALINRKDLLDLWQTYFNQTLKPKLRLRELEFVDSQSRNTWEQILLPKGMCWGGEGGAWMMDHYLNPELFDIYSETSSTNLILTRKMKYAEKGSIRVYQKFWNGETDEKVAPRILIYADLMGSGNSRCIEAAQRLWENGI